MSQFQWILAMVLLIGLGANAAGPSAVKKVQLCEILAHPEKFDRKMVTVQANYGGSWEGFYLGDPACSASHTQGEEYIYVAMSGDPSLPQGVPSMSFARDNGWHRFSDAEKHICNALSNTCTYDYIIADFTGMLIVQKNFRVKDGFGNGFGNLGMSKSALIWKSVENVSPHPANKQSSE